MEDIQGYQKPAENCQVIKPTIVPSLLLLQSFIPFTIRDTLSGWFWIN